MPKYELMYILSSGISDDQVPQAAENIQKIIADFGGTQIIEQQLGKKKLAYPVKKTRNGFYIVLTFNMDTKKINELDAKIRTQDATIIRYLLVNLDEHLVRLDKDVVAQANMNRNQQAGLAQKAAAENVLAKSEGIAKPAVELNAEELDKKIEEALIEDLTK